MKQPNYYIEDEERGGGGLAKLDSKGGRGRKGGGAGRGGAGRKGKE